MVSHLARTKRGLALLLLGLCACSLGPDFQTSDELLPRVAFPDRRTTPEELATLDLELLREASTPAPATPDYRMGPGDKLRVVVMGEEQLSAEYTIGPDGSIAVPLAGTLHLQGLTRSEAAVLMEEGLSPFFASRPTVGVSVIHYENNKVYVLGRVEMPGVVELTGSGTLLQAISEAGGLPVREYRSYLSRCAVIRGQDQIFWVDLLDLLQNGNIALNIPLHNGDVVYLPDAEDATVFVLGEVNAPGAVPIKVRLSLTSALAQAGGPTRDADLSALYLIRDPEDGGGTPRRIDLEYLLESGDFTQNYELESGDVLYVARNGWGDVSYVLNTLNPALSALSIGLALRQN